jgi:D-alanyl-D-alanine carboxypeptidase/D-alanyl-D-alanine-endopeptidase (penicillin-binding protein 4)
MRLKILFLLFFFSLFNSLTAQISAEKRLQDYVNTITNDNHLKGAFFSLKLVNFGTGKTIFEYNSELKMTPASLQKVITTGIGFVNLGENYTFKTSVYRDGIITADSILNGNLYIMGGGDPSLGSRNFPNTTSESVFDKITRGLKNAGISVINGAIIVDDSYFDGNYSTSETIHPSREWEDMGSYYGTGIHGLNFCENAFMVKVSCKKSAEIVISPEYPYTEIVMPNIIPDIITIHQDSLPNIVPFLYPEANRYIIRGEIPAGKEIELDCALQNPVGAFEFWLKNYLNSAGILIYNSIDSVFDREKYLLMEIESPPYRELARFTNYVSNNLFADAIFKNISKLTTDEASFLKSSTNMENLLKSLKLNTQDIRIVDGSGLSRHNLMTAGFLCEYLRTIKLHIPDFHLSLPSPGTNKSTLRYFMSNYADKNNKERIFLKSGSMTSVMNYAGYIVNKKGETICVAIMTNNFTCKTKDLKPKLERLVFLISEL